MNIDLFCNPVLLNDDERQKMKSIATTPEQFEILNQFDVFLLKRLTAYETQEIINFVQKIDSFMRIIESYVLLSKRSSKSILNNKTLEAFSSRYDQFVENKIVDGLVLFNLMTDRFENAIDSLRKLNFENEEIESS